MLAKTINGAVKMSAWLYLAFGILFEVIGTSSMKMSNGFTQPLPTIICITGFTFALFMLSQSVKSLDISVVYAIWSGAGVALIAMIGVFFFGEIMTPRRLFFLLLIIAGVIGLQLSEDPSPSNNSSQPGQ